MNSRPATKGKIRYAWWRAHHGLPQHAKWRGVAKAADVPVSVAFHIVMCLLDTASRGSPRGSINEFKAFDCAGIVDNSVDNVERVLTVLRDIHWIEAHMIADWDERQPQREDEGAAKRKAEQRSRTVTHPMRDMSQCHTPEAGQGVTSANVTVVSAPDKERKITSSETVAAREEGKLEPAGLLATALPAGALARQPSTEPTERPQEANGKKPAEATRADLEAVFAKKRTPTSPIKPAGRAADDGLGIPAFLARTA